MKRMHNSLKYSMIIGCIALLSACQISEQQVTEIAEPELTKPSPLSLNEYCAANSCRGDIDVLVATMNGEVRLQNSEFWPVIYNDEIIVLPGERLLIEADLDNDNGIQNLRYVEQNLHPERTFELYFSQRRGSYGMQFSLRNPFDVPIKFDIALTDVAGNSMSVGSCPVRAKRSYLERWANPAKQLTLSNPRALAENAEIICSNNVTSLFDSVPKSQL